MATRSAWRFSCANRRGGALEFLKTLVFQYLYLLGENVEDKEGLILPPASFARYAEAQDSFKAHYTSATADSRMPEACKFGTRFSPYGHNVIHGVIHASRLNGAAKQKGVTLTAYLTAILIMAVYETTLPFNNDNRPIVISMPVNLRKIFPSATCETFCGH